jgi:transcriptional regulator with XRE-family HTH domain
MNYFQQKLKQILKARQINQSKLAKIANIPQTTISKWLTKNATPSSKNVEILANALGISVGELIGDFGTNIQLTDLDKRFLALPYKDKEFLLSLLDSCNEHYKEIS